jgi:hypothetical protein
MSKMECEAYIASWSRRRQLVNGASVRLLWRLSRWLPAHSGGRAEGVTLAEERSEMGKIS